MRGGKKPRITVTTKISPGFGSASGSVDSERDTFLHGSEGESESQRRPVEKIPTDQYLKRVVEELLRTDKLGAEKKNQLDRTSVAKVDSSASSSSSTQPPPIPRLGPYPKGGSFLEIHNWCKERAEIMKARENDPLYSLPTVRAPKDDCTTDAVHYWNHKKAVLAAARSIVSIAAISDEQPTRPQCTGFMLHRCYYSGVGFSVIVTSSALVCVMGRKLDPLPKLSVGLPDKKTVIEAHLLYFNDHFDIALLLLPNEVSLDTPRLGSCPDYNQEVFVLGRDKEASLRVRHGVISWTEESDLLDRNHYMFLDGEVPEDVTGGPVIDLDGVFRGMVFSLSPEPPVISISTISTCLKMFMQFGRIAWPLHGLSLRTVASLDVELLECLSDHNIKSGYIVDLVLDNSPAMRYGIRMGNVIVSLNGHDMLTLPQLEDYFLSLGWINLENSVSTMDLSMSLNFLFHPGDASGSMFGLAVLYA